MTKESDIELLDSWTNSDDHDKLECTCNSTAYSVIDSIVSLFTLRTCTRGISDWFVRRSMLSAQKRPELDF